VIGKRRRCLSPRKCDGAPPLLASAPCTFGWLVVHSIVHDRPRWVTRSSVNEWFSRCVSPLLSARFRDPAPRLLVVTAPPLITAAWCTRDLPRDFVGRTVRSAPFLPVFLPFALAEYLVVLLPPQVV